jgi:hypothetical protein
MSLGVTLDLGSIQAKLGDLEERGADNMARIERQLRLLNASIQKLQSREPVHCPREEAQTADSSLRRADLQGIREELAGLSQHVAALVDTLVRATARMRTPDRAVSRTPDRAVSRAETPEHAASRPHTLDYAASVLERLERAAAGADALGGTRSRRGSDASDSSFCLP